MLVSFDPELITYQELLRSYWRNVDPSDGEGQFCDRGNSYRPVIFTRGKSQRNDAIESTEKAAKELDQSILSIKVEIQDAKTFWLAEEYHQNFAKRNSLKYKFYRNSCGRDRRLDDVWRDRARTDHGWITSSEI